jgi:putative transposase
MDGQKRSDDVKDEAKSKAERVALFRWGLIGDLVHLEPGTRGLQRMLEEKAARDYAIPGSTRTRVAAETMRHWLRAYRNGGGLDALKPRPRSDMGATRAVPQDVRDLLVSIKDDNPELSVQLVIKEAFARGKVPDDIPLSPTTVHRLLSRAGVMRRPSDGDGGGGTDRRRFAYEKAGELWMSDVMHGPTVLVAGRVRRKTYLIAFIDDATRVVPYAAFALGENVAAFLPVLKQAVMRRGLPKRLFVDNGAAYRSYQLALACARLGVTLIHARAYQPESKGKMERWFRTVRTQLLPTLVDAHTASLEALNRRLWAWVEGEYHQSPHRGLDGETPLDRWAARSADVRYVEQGVDLDELFLSEAKRRVQKDRTVSLNGLVYEVDAALVGATVTLRFDPATQQRGVQVWHGGRKVQDAKVVNVYANAFVKRDRAGHRLEPSAPPDAPPPGLRYSGLKRDEEEK